MTHRLLRRLRAFGTQKSGTLAVFAALSAGLIFGMSALVVDGGRLYVLKRQQQSVTDIAAMAAAANMTNAALAATTNLANSGVASTALASLEYGLYVADPAIAAAQRFVPTPLANANAVRITLHSNAVPFFGAFLSSGSVGITTRAIGVNKAAAAFALQGVPPGIDIGLANGLWSGLLGTAINMTTLDYLTLGTSSVDLFAFSNALAARVAVSGTYTSLAATRVRLSDIYAALANILTGPASAVMHALAIEASLSNISLPFGTLVGFGMYGNLPVGSPAPIAATFPVMPLIIQALRLATAGTIVVAPLTPTGSGLLGGTMKLVTGTPVAGSSFAAIGPVGAAVHTVQTRLFLSMQVPGAGSIPALTLPVYIQTASAVGQIAAVSCSGASPSVTLSITPGTSDAFIGTVGDQDLSNLADTPVPVAATLLNTPLLKLLAYSHASIGSSNSTLVPFSAPDIAALTMKTTVSSDLNLAMVSTLLANTQLQADGLSLGFGTQSAVSTAVSQIMASALRPIASTLDNTLLMLGITTGDAESWVGGVRCGQGALVN